MTQIHTHYDNLKVARNAPLEVIRAAYRTLSQKFHPDRNPGNAEAARIMAIINMSYDVLSDPDKRQAHDRWIAQQELLAAEGKEAIPSSTASRSAPVQQSPSSNAGFVGIVAHIFRYWFWYGLAGFFLWISLIDERSSPPAGPKPYQATPPAPLAKPAYVRPTAAPNGQEWPTTAAYVKGYQRLHTAGLSSVTVDNSRNVSDVFGKLVSLDGPKAYPVRSFFIPARSSFTLTKVTPGSYDVRYRDLSDGGLSRSEAFEIEEIATDEGTKYSKFTMTLYKVRHGNMQTYRLSEAEF